MHSWRDLIECCARSFYAMGQESQVWARGSRALQPGTVNVEPLNPGISKGYEIVFDFKIWVVRKKLFEMYKNS